jgi:MFS family permease
MNKSPDPGNSSPWYQGLTRYHWLVLALASAGWVFDVYEGQIFNITRDQLLTDLLPTTAQAADVRFYGDVFLGVFLVGGALGGILFGLLADRWGRRPTLAATILVYSLFSGLTYFADSLWQVGVLRFLVAVGVGGEWSVAAALVAETFPTRARAYAASIFHASSILGTWLASLAALASGADWRTTYLVGVLPALLIFGIRAGVREPESWSKAHTEAPTGRLQELLTDRMWRKRAILGLLLAAVGLGTFWAVTVAGQDLAREFLLRAGVPAADAQAQAKFAYGIVETAGGGLGLLSFGPLSVRFGRRPAFTGLLLASVVVVPLTCYLPTEWWQLLVLLPLFGFCTLGIHAGFAVYFPELFPARLRATAAGFCFNGGRLAAATLLIFSGWLKSQPGIDLRLAVTLLSGLFLLGVLVVWFMPETKGMPLPE